MNIKPIIALVTAGALIALGCTQAETPKSELAERAGSTEPTLTSTVPERPAEPIADKADVIEVEADIVEKKADAAEEKKSEPPRFEPELGSVDGLTIRRLVATSAIDAREPVFASSVFDRHEDKIYAFVEASNASELEETLVVHFIGPDGQASGGIELRIPPSVPRWRTWAYTKHAKAAGLWRIEIRNPDGALIAALPFEVEADG
jgi:hypothetical protein